MQRRLKESPTNTVPNAAIMTALELLSLPDDETDRWLIHGQMRERPKVIHDRIHAAALARIGTLLLNWQDSRPAPRGRVYGGCVGCWLRRDPDTILGIDIVYLSPELAACQAEEDGLVEGALTLAVEILAPNDCERDMNEKLAEYLRTGVPVVWLVDPVFRTVDVYRPDAPPVRFNEQQELTAEPYLPGFRVPVAQLFSR